MKLNFLNIVLISLVGIGLSGCFGGSKSPTEVTQTFSDNYNKSGDYNKLADVVTKDSYIVAAQFGCMGFDKKQELKQKCSKIKGLKPDNSATEEQYNIAKEIGLMFIKSALSDRKVETIKITNEETNGDEAIVTFINEKNKEEKIYLTKVNGEWKIDIPKLFEIAFKNK